MQQMAIFEISFLGKIRLEILCETLVSSGGGCKGWIGKTVPWDRCLPSFGKPCDARTDFSMYSSHP